MASSGLHQMAASVITRSKLLINNDLKKICKEEGLPQSGVKAVLQGRVIALINRAVHENDHVLFNRLQHRVAHNGNAPPPSTVAGSFPVRPPNHPSPTVANGYPASNGYQQAHGGYQQSPQVPRPPQYFFKESPFFEIRELVLSGITLEASPSHRHNCAKHIMLNDAISARLRSDPTLRLLLFSAMEQPLAPYTRLDVAFPGQIEVRINGDEVKANYKGLKNKPGSTRPADITDYVRISPANYRNNLVITYALTQKKYNMFVYMVRKFSVEDLAKRIKTRNVITKQFVLDQMRKKASDPDIVVESSVMSLKDPVSTLRITTPCRSMICTHNRCFDAESFLQLQEQAPTWQCPICNKTISFEALAVDEYVQEILDIAPRSADQVTIEPDGQWSTNKETLVSNANGHGHGDDSDDDLVEISDFRLAAIKGEAVYTPQSLAKTPSLASREASTAPRTGSKRTSEVIDLTLSDDDEPVRPAKKVAYNRLPDSSHRYSLPSYGSSSVPMRPQAQPPHSISPGLPMDPPSTQHRQSYGDYRPLPPQPHGYPGQGSPTYPAYIGSSP